MWQRWTWESVSSSLSMQARSGMSHGAAPTAKISGLSGQKTDRSQFIQDFKRCLSRWFPEFGRILRGRPVLVRGSLPTTNALNLRFFHNLRFRNSSFAVSLVANCRMREANETKTFHSWQLRKTIYGSYERRTTKSYRPKRVSIVAL